MGNLFFGLLGYCVLGLFGSWVAGLLGCWVVVFWGCWVVQTSNPTTKQPKDNRRQQPSQQRHKKQKRQQGQKRQPHHPQLNQYGPAECAKRLNPPTPVRRLESLFVPVRTREGFPPLPSRRPCTFRRATLPERQQAPSGASTTPLSTFVFLFGFWSHMWTA